MRYKLIRNENRLETALVEDKFLGKLSFLLHKHIAYQSAHKVLLAQMNDERRGFCVLEILLKYGQTTQQHIKSVNEWT